MRSAAGNLTKPKISEEIPMGLEPLRLALMQKPTANRFTIRRLERRELEALAASGDSPLARSRPNPLACIA